MSKNHPDAAALNLLGTKAIKEHFQISDSQVTYWRQQGIPKGYRKPVVLLAKNLGHDIAAMVPAQDPVTSRETAAT